MATTKQAVTSLLTEHLNYTPLTLLDDIINTINELVYRAVSAVEQGLTNAPPSSLGFGPRTEAENDQGEARHEIENGVHQLETLLETAVDKYFDKMEIYVLRNILHIPEDVALYAQLPHYKNLTFASEKGTTTPEELHRLRRKVHETRRLQNALQAEAARNSELISNLKGVLAPQNPSATGATQPGDLAFLMQSGQDGGGLKLDVKDSHEVSKRPLTGQTHLAVSQLPVLKQLLVDLRQKLDDDVLKASRSARSDEMRDYLEGRAKGVLERHGVDVDSGEGLVGPNGLNRPVGKDELSGIEQVAGALARTTDDDKMEE